MIVELFNLFRMIKYAAHKLFYKLKFGCYSELTNYTKTNRQICIINLKSQSIMHPNLIIFVHEKKAVRKNKKKYAPSSLTCVPTDRYYHYFPNSLFCV